MNNQALYRHFNAAGELLYIGVSSRIPQRIKEHSKHSAWWREISNITIEHFDSRSAVLSAERAAIQREKPKYNIHHVVKIIAEPKASARLGGDLIVGKLVALKPLYKLSEAGDAVGIGARTIRQEIEAGRLGFVEIPSPKAGNPTRYVSGWQILEWLDLMAARASERDAA